MVLVAPFAARTVRVTNPPAPAPSPCQNIGTAHGSGKRDRFARRFGSRGRGGDLFGPESLTLAAKTLERFVARATRPSEQEPGETSRLRPVWIIPARWIRWAGAGMAAASVFGNRATPVPDLPEIVSPRVDNVISEP